MKRNDEGGLLFLWTGDKCESCSHAEVCEVVRRLQVAVTDLHVSVEVTVTTCETYNEREVKP